VVDPYTAKPLCIESEWNESREVITKKAVVMPAHWRGHVSTEPTRYDERGYQILDFSHWDYQHAEYSSLTLEQQVAHGFPRMPVVVFEPERVTEEAVREERIDMQHWHADINTDKGTVRVEQSGVSTPWWRAAGIPGCDDPDVTTLTETVVVTPGVEIGSIPKERAYEFAVNNNVTIQGHYRSREFLIPSNTLSIFS
jgi:hypothetical protein